MKRLASLLVAAAVPVLLGCAEPRPFFSIKPEPENYSWWLRADFRPFGKEIRGLPLSRFDSTWCSANELRLELFPPGLLDEKSEHPMEKLGASFSVRLNPDSVRQFEAVIGVYQRCGAERGTFLLIFDTSQRAVVLEQWHEANAAFFAVLYKADEQTLELVSCFECDNITRLRWDSSTSRFMWLPDDSEPGG